MRQLKPPKSIKDYGGLDSYLDDPVILEKHNGYGSDDWHKNKHKGAAFMRDLFGLKTTGFYYRYLKYEKEHPNAPTK